MGAADAYLADLAHRVAALRGNAEPIEAAAAAVADAIAAGGALFIFGTGHSHMIAEEGHYRAGGLAAIVPILEPALMLHEGAVASTTAERRSGVAAPLLERYGVGAHDAILIVSNSGVNAVPVEAAMEARRRGATVIAITSQAYSLQAAAGRTRLADIADIVLDNGAPPGDATQKLPGAASSTGPISTAIGAALLNAVVVGVVERLLAGGLTPPVYVSANMPDAARTNEALVERYRPRNPHL